MRFPKAILLLILALVTIGCNRDPEVAKKKYLDSGNRYFENEKFKEASIMYRKSLQQDLRFGEAYYRLGLSELKLGRPVEALRALQRAVELDPENQDAPAKLAELFLAAYTSDPKHPEQFLNEVEELTKKILDRNPKSYDGLRLRGFLLLTKKDLNGAIADFQRADEIKPNQSPLSLVLAQSLLAAGQQAEAEKIAVSGIEKEKTFAPFYDFLFTYYSGQKNLAKAEEILKLKSANNPKNASYILQIAAYYYLSNQKPESQRQLERLLSNSADFPNANILVGDFYFRVRDLDKAKAHYEKGIANEPKEKSTYQKRIVQLLTAQGKNEEAGKLVSEILKENPQDDVAQAMRGSLALRSGSKEQLDVALKDLQAVVEKTPNNPVLRHEYGRALMLKGDNEGAKAQFQEAIKQRTDYLPPRFALTQIYLASGDFANSIQTANQILQYEPNNVPAKLLRSSAMIRTREYVNARQELNALLNQNPALTGVQANDAHFQLGMINFSEGKYKEAESIFRKLYQTSPQDPRGLMGMVQAMSAQNQAPQALSLLKIEIQKSPERQDLRFALARAAAQANDSELAITEYKKLIDAFPKDFGLAVNLAEVYRKKGDTQSAINVLTKAQEIDNTHPVTSLTLAMLYESTGQRDKSKAFYEKVLQREPENPLALNNLAFIMAEQGNDLDQALTMVQRAKSKLPNNPEVSDTMGWIYIKKNLNDNAIGIFRDLTTKHPERSTFHYHLGMAQFQKGDKTGAIKSLQTALTKNPDKEEEGKIRELIAKIG